MKQRIFMVEEICFLKCVNWSFLKGVSSSFDRFNSVWLCLWSLMSIYVFKVMKNHIAEANPLKQHTKSVLARSKIASIVFLLICKVSSSKKNCTKAIYENKSVWVASFLIWLKLYHAVGVEDWHQLGNNWIFYSIISNDSPYWNIEYSEDYWLTSLHRFFNVYGKST